MKDAPDAVDRLLAAWRATHPNLDPSPLDLVGRVIVLAEHLRRSAEAALKKHELLLGQFDILATLRRNDAKGGMTPGALLKSVVLSSGSMTNRLDRLEDAGLIARGDDPSDRRGVLVKLTAKGRKLIDAATATRFAEAKQSLPPLNAKDAKQLTQLLRKWLGAYEPDQTDCAG